MKLSFTKMQGLGNDFIVIDGRGFPLPQSRKTVRALSDRRHGIGADQILLVKNSRKADFRLEIYNADGGEVEMCGNGLRAVAKYLRDKNLTSKSPLRIETKAGVHTVEAQRKNRFQVDMGEPVLKGKLIPVNLAGRVINRPIRIDGKMFRITCVSMGNPHCVVYVDDLKEFAIGVYGPILEKNHIFPKRTNVEFVRVLGPREIEMRVWERGTGETLACGSGACAAVVASVLNSLTDREVEVKLAGGSLHVAWPREDGHVYLTGPAETVFHGEIEI